MSGDATDRPNDGGQARGFRVNWKLLAAVLGMLGILGLVGGALWLRNVRKNPRRYEAQAEAALKQGNYKDAVPLYGRSLHLAVKKEDRIRLTKRIAETIAKMPVEKNVQADQYFRTILQQKEDLLELDPEDTATLGEVLEAYFVIAADAGTNLAWDDLRLKSERLLAKTPDSPLALKYNGIARVVWMERFKLEDKLRRETREVLEKARRAMPADHELAFYLAVWYINESRVLYELSRKEEAGEALALARKVMEDYVKAYPDNLEAQFRLARVLVDVGRATATIASSQDMQDAALQAGRQMETLEKRMLAEDNDRQKLTIDLASLIRLTDNQPAMLPDGQYSTRGNERAIVLLNHVLARHPVQCEALYGLGSIYRATKRLDLATAAYAKAAESRVVAVDVEALRQCGIQLAALYEWIRALLEKREQTEDAAASRKLLREAKDILARFREDVAATPAMDLLEGRMALAENRLWLAVEKLDAADARLEHKNSEAIFLAGVALSRLGQYGAALNRLQTAFSLPESAAGDMRIRIARELVDPLAHLGRIEEATRITHALNQGIPNDPDTHLLMARVLEAQAKTFGPGRNQEKLQLLWQAINLIKPWASQDNPRAERQLASLFLSLGDPEQARAILSRYVQKVPDDRQTLCQLVDVELKLGLADSALAHARNAIARQGSNPVAELAIQAIQATSGPLRDQGAFLLFAALDSSPVARDLKAEEKLRGLGLTDEADRALARVEAAAPDAPELALRQFEIAMRAKNIERAAAAIARAEQKQADAAEVLLMRARVFMAGQRMSEAATALGDATRKRPFWSEAWTLLGAVHRSMGSTNEAAADFQKAIELKPDNQVALLEMFRLADGEKDPEKAIGCLRLMLRNAPDDAILMDMFLDYQAQFGDKQEALRIREQIATLRPEDFSNRRALALLYLRTAQLERARSILEPLLREAPDNRENVVAYATLERACGRLANGKKKFDDYLSRLGPRATVDDWLAFARFLRQTALVEETAVAYGKARALQDPKTLSVWREMAEWKASTNSPAEALALYREYRGKTKNQEVIPIIMDLLMNLGRSDDAEIELAAWKKATAPSVSIRQIVAEALLFSARGRNTAADQIITAALAAHGEVAILYLIRARIHVNDTLDENVQNQVKSDLMRALQLVPNDLVAREMMQNWYLRRNRLPEAVEQLVELVRIKPENFVYRQQLAQLYLRLGRRDDAVRFLQQCMVNAKDPAWPRMLAVIYRDEEKLSEALKQYAVAYGMQPNPSASNTAMYVEALLEAGQPVPARDIATKNLPLLKKSALLNALLGRALAATGDVAAADRCFTSALNLAVSTDADLEAVIRQIRTVESAPLVIVRLDKIRPAANAVRVDVCKARVLMGNGQTDAALAVLEKSMADLPASDPAVRQSALWLAGAAYQSKRQFVKARAAYEGFLRLQPDNMAVLNNLAWLVAEDMKKPEEALPLVVKAAANWQGTDTERANILDTLGRIQFLAGLRADAIRTLQSSIALQDTGVARLHLAEALIGQSRMIEARSELVRAQQQVEKKPGRSGAELQAKLAELWAVVSKQSGGSVSRMMSLLDEPVAGETDKKKERVRSVFDEPLSTETAKARDHRRSLFDEPAAPPPKK